MLPKVERLGKRNGFVQTYSLRKTVSTHAMILYTGMLKTNPARPVKVGFVVSKKVFKKAVGRNRVKRLMREAYRNFRKENEVTVNQWESLIFAAKEHIVELNYKQVYDNIVECLIKAEKKYGNQAIESRQKQHKPYKT